MSTNNVKDLPLSLKSDTFSELSSDFDSMLAQLLQGMVDTEESTGTINIKLKVLLTPDSAPDFETDGETRTITKPKFEHEVSAVIQRKDKRSGSLSGNFELVRDGDGYVMRPIDDGQYTLFGDGEGGQEGEDTSDGQESPKDATKRFEGTPFGWLAQFIDDELKVTEAMGNYTVRNKDNKVVLSSAVGPDAMFYCPAEKLKPHIGHKLNCVAYGQEEIVNIAIECEDCGEVLYDIERPGQDDDDPGETPFEEAGNDEEVGDSEPSGEPGDGDDYGYDDPAGDDGDGEGDV